MVYGLPWLDSLRAIKLSTGCLGLIKRPSALIKRRLGAIKLAVNDKTASEPRFVSLHVGLDKTATRPAIGPGVDKTAIGPPIDTTAIGPACAENSLTRLIDNSQFAAEIWRSGHPLSLP